MDAGCCPEATGSTGMQGPAPAVAGAGSGAVTGRAPAGQHGRAAAPCPPRPPRLFCRHWYKAQSLKSAAAVGRWRVLAERKQGVRGLGKRSSSERRQSSACAGPAEERGGPEAPKRGRCLMLNLRSPPLLLAGEAGSNEPWHCGPAQALAAGLPQAEGAPPAPAPSDCSQAEAQGCSPSAPGQGRPGPGRLWGQSGGPLAEPASPASSAGRQGQTWWPVGR